MIWLCAGEAQAGTRENETQDFLVLLSAERPIAPMTRTPITQRWADILLVTYTDIQQVVLSSSWGSPICTNCLMLFGRLLLRQVLKIVLSPQDRVQSRPIEGTEANTRSLL